MRWEELDGEPGEFFSQFFPISWVGRSTVHEEESLDGQPLSSVGEKASLVHSRKSSLVAQAFASNLHMTPILFFMPLFC